MKHCKILRYLFAAAALFSGLGLGLGGAPQPALALTDLAPTHWAASTINAYVSRGIMNGYPDGTFRPEAAVTRAEFVKMVNSVFGYNTTTTIDFPDVSSSYWGYDEIAKGVLAGYINGDENGYFNPDSPLTREEAASIICRIKGLAPNQSAISTYTDSARISTWAAPYVGAATQFGYMQGSGDGSFNPTQALTRAEAASVLAKAETKTTYSGSNTSSGTTSGVTNNNVQFKPGVSTSTSTTKVTDYTMGTSETSLSGKTITGDLYIPSGLGSKTVNLDDLVVNGTVYVRGGGTIDVDNCDFNKVVLDKSGVTFITDSKSTVDELEFQRNGRIDGKGYGDVTIADDSVSTVTINATVDSLLLDTDADVRLMRSASIDDFEATSNANRATINFASGAYVNEMDLYDHVQITGSGEINKMYTYVSGVYSSIEPNRLVTSGSGTRPTYTNDNDSSSGSSGSSGGSSGTTTPGGTTTTTVKDLVATSNVDGTTSRGGVTTYDTVTVKKTGVTVNNVVVDKSLVIDAAVADGTVTLSHVTVKGPVYIHGGGQNSVIFIDCTLEGNIYIDKQATDSAKQPVALKLNDGTQLKGDIIVSSNAYISTSPKEYVLNQIVVNGTLTEPLKIDAFVKTLTVDNSSALSIELSNGIIDNLVAKDAEVTVKGTGYLNNVNEAPNLDIDMLTPPDENTLPSLPNFKSVLSLSGIPGEIEMGVPLDLNICQAKYSDSSTAAISNVEWAVTDDTAGVSIIDGHLLTASKVGSFKLTATVKNGQGIGVEYTKTFSVDVTEVFVNAERILANFPSTVTLEEGKPMVIDLKQDVYGVTVDPSNATNKDITWTVSGTGSLKDNRFLTLNEAGQVTLTATINNGKGVGSPTRNTFTITVKAPYCPVGNISLNPKDIAYDETKDEYTAYVGTDFVLNPVVTAPEGKESVRPTNTKVRWELVNDDNTGITASDLNNDSPTIKTINTGKIILNAIVDGGLDDGANPYEQEIIINVKPALIGTVLIKPDSISGQNVYYPGQSIRFTIDDETMAEYEDNLTWSIDNLNVLSLYIKDDAQLPKFDDKNSVMPILTIPKDFPIDDISTIRIKVENSADRTAYKTTIITVTDPFISVEDIRNTDLKDGDDSNLQTLEIPMTGGVAYASYDLSNFTVQPTNAICKDIEWKIEPEEASGARIEDEQLIVTKSGNFTLTATIKNGTFVGKGYGEDFENYEKEFNINVLVPPIGPITAETPALNGDNYYSGQKVTFSMDASILNEHGKNIEWTVSPTTVTGEKDDTGKYTVTIPDSFSGKLTVTAKNETTEDTATKEINVTKFNAINPNDTNIKITVPDENSKVKVGGTATITFTGATLSAGQSIEWDVTGNNDDKTTIAGSTTNKTTATLTIGASENSNDVQVVAKVVNGTLDADNNKLGDVEFTSDTVSINFLEVSGIYVGDTLLPTSKTDDIPEFYAGENIQLAIDRLAGTITDRQVTWDISNLDEILVSYPNSSTPDPAISATGLLTNTSMLTKTPDTNGTILEITAKTGTQEYIAYVKIVPGFVSATTLTISTEGNTKNAERGGTLQFLATVTPDNATKVEDVTWSITTTNKKPDTTIDEKGLLKIAADETASIIVKATIVGGNLTNNTLKDVTSSTITITPFTSVTDLTLSINTPTDTSVKFTTNVEPASPTNSTVTWAIDGNKSTSTKITSGTLTINAAETSTEIKVTATIKNGVLGEDGTLQPITATATVTLDGAGKITNVSIDQKTRTATMPSASNGLPTATSLEDDQPTSNTTTSNSGSNSTSSSKPNSNSTSSSNSSSSTNSSNNSSSSNSNAPLSQTTNQQDKIDSKNAASGVKPVWQ